MNVVLFTDLRILHRKQKSSSRLGRNPVLLAVCYSPTVYWALHFLQKDEWEGTGSDVAHESKSEKRVPSACRYYHVSVQ